ncbi:MAG: S8 family peptidase [Blastocatellia bacterium]
MKRVLVSICLAILCLLQAVPLSPSHCSANVLAQSKRMEEAAAPAPFNEDARAEKLPTDLISMIDNGSDDKRQDFIVQMNEPPTRAHRQMIRQRGGTIKHQFENINALLVALPVSQVQALAADPMVAFITPDRQVNGSMDAATKLVGADQLRQVMPATYGGNYAPLTGAGVGIAVIDSGISSANKDDFRSNATIASRILNFKDFCGDVNGAIHTNEYDDYGHGTTVAGVAAGSGWGSQQYDAQGVECYPGNYGDFIGIAPTASLVVCKVINKYGSGTASNVIKALDYCINNKLRYNIRVINLSIGAPVLQSYKTDPLCQAVERCVQAGIIVVCAAGNIGHNDTVVGYDENGKPLYQTVYGGINSPANDPYVITVGATKDPKESVLTWHWDAATSSYQLDLNPSPNLLRRTDLQVASFSSRGPALVDGIIKPDLVAPGVKIIAAATRNTAYLTDEVLPGTVMPRNASGGAPPKLYNQLSGTSFAAPIVTGTVALMIQANPTLDPSLVKAILQMTSQQLPTHSSMSPIERLLTEGAGLVNTYAAVRLVQNLRSYVNKALAGQTLLKPGESLSGLNEDMKLVLKDENGNPLEYAVLDSGILLVNGILLSDGLLLADGHLLANGHLIANGILLANSILLANGSIWPEGHLLADSYAQTYCLQASGTQTVTLQRPIEHWINNNPATPNASFYADGILSATGYMDGNLIFSPQSLAVWSSAVVDPTAMTAGPGAESVSILASNDDTAISGVRFIPGSSPYFPKPRPPLSGPIR